jgi:hypothetical protein
MATNPFDQASRYLAKLDPPAFLGWLLRLTPAQLVFRRWLDTRLLRFPGEPERTCDTVAFLEDPAAGHVPWAVVVEFQIEPDPLMFGRLLGYLGPLWLEQKPSPERGDRFHVGAILVNLTGRGQAGRTLAWPQSGLLTQLQVVECNLAGYDAAAVLQEIAAGPSPAVLLPLIPLMHGGGESGILAVWQQLAGQEPDARRRGDYGGLALVFAEAAGCWELWKAALKEWNVVQSQQVLEWQAAAKAEGKTEGMAEAVLEVLEARLGPLPAELPGRLRSLRDPVLLKRLLVSAVRCPTLDEFLRDLPAG